MVKKLTHEQAWNLLAEYSKGPFHLKHALTVDGVMKYFAKELGYGDEEDFRDIVGLLHNLELKSVKKKYKSSNFSVGCSIEVIKRGANMLGLELDDLISKTILAMRSCESVYESI